MALATVRRAVDTDVDALVRIQSDTWRAAYADLVPAEALAQLSGPAAREAWRDAGREGEPRLAALVYYGLGDEEASKASLRGYYGFLGEWAEAIAAGAVRSPQAAAATARAFADIGITELVFDPTIASLDEVDRLADAVL